MSLSIYPEIPGYVQCFADILLPLDENMNVSETGNILFMSSLGFCVPQNEKPLEKRKQEFLKSKDYVLIHTSEPLAGDDAFYVKKEYLESPAIKRVKLDLP